MPARKHDGPCLVGPSLLHNARHQALAAVVAFALRLPEHIVGVALDQVALTASGDLDLFSDGAEAGLAVVAAADDAVFLIDIAAVKLAAGGLETVPALVALQI